MPWMQLFDVPSMSSHCTLYCCEQESIVLQESQPKEHVFAQYVPRKVWRPFSICTPLSALSHVRVRIRSHMDDIILMLSSRRQQWPLWSHLM